MGPASTIPAPPPTAAMAATTPTPPATLTAGNSSRMMPKARGRTAPPMPWMARATISTPIEWASPAMTDPSGQGGEGGHQHALLAHHVADPAEDGGEDRRRQQVGGQHPRHGGLRGVEVVLDGGEDRGHQRLQQGVGGDAQQEDDEGDFVAGPLE